MSKYRLLDAGEAMMKQSECFCSDDKWAFTPPELVGIALDPRFKPPYRVPDDGNGDYVLLDPNNVTVDGDEGWITAARHEGITGQWVLLCAGKPVGDAVVRRKRKWSTVDNSTLAPKHWVVLANGQLSSDHWEESTAINEAKALRLNGHTVFVAHITHEFHIETVRTVVVKEVGN